MSPAHLHLLLNHLPLIGIPFSLGFLVQSIRKHSDSSRNFALVVLLLSCLLSIPVYLTGEPAEDLIKTVVSGIDVRNIHEHEGVAQVSLILCIITGATALCALLLKRRQVRSSFTFAAITLAFASTCTLAYTSFLGGKIRHTEFHQN